MSSWWNDLVAAAPTGARAQLAQEGLGDRVTAELAMARARWPGSAAAVTDGAFGEALLAQLAAQRDPAAALGRLRVDDLVLARWCATGDRRAIQAFEEVFRDDIDAVLARFRRLAATPDELRQILRIKLFVGAEGRGPRIAEYAGFGFLQNWFRVTALRAFVDVARGERARRLEELLADDDLVGIPALGPGLAARMTRSELGRAIKHAFARAVAGLAPRQRNFLRHAHVDSLTLDQIAALYTIHRATVARTLAAARAELVERTRSELAAVLQIDADELDSIVRAADSRIDLSLSRILRAEAREDDSEPGAPGTSGAPGAPARSPR